MAEHIQKSLTQFLDNLKKKNSDKKEILLVLNKILNKDIQKHIQNIHLYKDNLVIKVDNALWGYQLNLLTPQILRLLQKKGIERVKDIKVKVKR